MRICATSQKWAIGWTTDRGLYPTTYSRLGIKTNYKKLYAAKN